MASSVITQVQQGPPAGGLGSLNTALSGPDDNITLELRGTRFTLSRDELLTLPEFVLLSLFPNGLLPESQNQYHGGEAGSEVWSVDYDPQSLQYMLEFFRNVAQSIPTGSTNGETESAAGTVGIEPISGTAPNQILQDRAGIIVLREDLDFYCIPPSPTIEAQEMVEIKRAAGRKLVGEGGVFGGLKKSTEAGGQGSTEQHLIEMLTAGGFDPNSTWGHRAAEPNKAVICSIALARLRTDIQPGVGNMNNANVGMAQKLLLFWRKPARRCWWEGVELEGIEGVPGKLKVWIRRVWTLEMSVIGLR